ncbi:MAG: Peptide/opine/nickel uptake family transporter, permease protein [Devosia sp.]|nr:Peptide/opine/nickel uptake family transporter, permease protein [Devosia sp.]
MTDLATAPLRRDSLLRAALGSRNFVVGAVITLGILLLAVVSFIWTPFPFSAQDIPNKFKPPLTGSHLLGTDYLGRDMLSMIMVGARTSISVALLAVGIGALIGTPLGLWAAARRGTLLDEIIMRANDLVFAFPALLIAILITALYGPGAVNAIIAIGIFNVPVFARLARGAALSLWTREFILAARVAGKGAARISAEHILPNILNTLVVQITIQFALGILAEAALAYVGLGAQPPMTSWGKMLADSQTMVALAPHVAIVPGLTIVVTVLGVNLLGDGLRDILDPRLRRSRR